MPAHRPVRAARRGSVLIELALALTVLVPLLLGVAAIGIRLGRTLQATELTRDVAHMYALGTDFSLPGTQTIVATLSQSFSLTSTSQSVLLFSSVLKVQQTDCTAAGLQTCPNLNLTVFTQRLAIGNTAQLTSAFGTPPSAYIGSGGNIAAADYCRQSSLVATGFDSVLALTAGQTSTVVEGYFNMPDINFIGLPGAGGGYYVRFLF